MYIIIKRAKRNTLDICIFQAQTCNRSGLGGNFIVDGVQALGAGAVEVEPPVADEVLLYVLDLWEREIEKNGPRERDKERWM